MTTMTIAYRIKELNKVRTDFTITTKTPELKVLPHVGNLIRINLRLDISKLDETPVEYVVEKRVFYNLKDRKDGEWDFYLILSQTSNFNDFRKIVLTCKCHFFSFGQREDYKNQNAINLEDKKYQFILIPNCNEDYIEVDDKYVQFDKLIYDIENECVNMQVQKEWTYDQVFS